MTYLSTAEVDTIADNVFDNLGYNQSTRTILMSNINKKFVALLASDHNDSTQLDLDLIRLNSTPRLTDGTIPFESWLERAARQLKPFPEASRVIQQALAQISAKSSSVPVDDPSPPAAAVIDNVVREKSVHKDDMVSFAFLEAGVKAGNAVVRMKVPRHENGAPRIIDNKPAIYLGTGWLLTTDLVITNHHVINARENNEPSATVADFQLQSSKTEVQFDFDRESMDGKTLAVSRLEAADRALDFAIFRLPQKVQRTPLTLSPTKIVLPAGEAPVVNIIQHPFGHAKRVALRNNHMYDTQYPKVRYFTDTEGGSSGSPVFNDNWEVVALHRASTLVDNVSYNGQLTAWVNEGVQINAIVEHLRTNHPAITAELGL